MAIRRLENKIKVQNQSNKITKRSFNICHHISKIGETGVIFFGKDSETVWFSMDRHSPMFLSKMSPYWEYREFWRR